MKLRIFKKKKNLGPFWGEFRIQFLVAMLQQPQPRHKLPADVEGTKTLFPKYHENRCVFKENRGCT